MAPILALLFGPHTIYYRVYPGLVNGSVFMRPDLAHRRRVTPDAAPRDSRRRHHIAPDATPHNSRIHHHVVPDATAMRSPMPPLVASDAAAS